MFKYIVKRLLVAIPTFFGITVLVYLISAMAPGNELSTDFSAGISRIKIIEIIFDS